MPREQTNVQPQTMSKASATKSTKEPSREQQVDAMVERLQGRLLGDLQETVQWFHQQMPRYYFQVLPIFVLLAARVATCSAAH